MSDERYPSKVVRRTYATALGEQLEQLETDELVLRFAASRESLSSDRHRPLYHYVPPEGPSNDPNGFLIWQDRFHLFYQQYPPEDRRQHWGHAVSDDLVYWRDLPIAIYPGVEERCHSGGAFVEEDRAMVCYHGTQAGTIIAESSDPLLLNWEKISGGPVIREVEDGQPGDPYALGDPCLWKGEKGYYSLSGSRDAGTHLVDCTPLPHLFFSEDLRNWEYCGPFLEGNIFTSPGEDCAVPYFWPLGDRHILIFGSHMRGSQYLLGDWNEEAGKFTPFAYDRFCCGPINNGGINAPTAYPDGEGGVYLWHMMSYGLITGDWNGIMTLPTRLRLDGSTVMNEPVEALDKLREDHRQIGEMRLPANQDVLLEEIAGDSIEMIARIDPGAAREVSIDVLRSPDGAETTSLRYLKNGGTVKSKGPETWHDIVILDIGRSSLLPDVLPRPPETANFKLGEDEVLELRIFVDRGIVELFANGRRHLAVRVHPGREDSVGVSIRAQGGEATLRSLDAWRMRSIWD